MPLAIIAGRGALPGALYRADPGAVFVLLDGVGADAPEGAVTIPASFEKLGRLFSDLRAAGTDRVVMAGAMDRPALNPAKFDLKMLGLAPGLMKAYRQGDDGLLRKVVDIFEQEGLAIVGPAAVAPDLVLPGGNFAGPKPGKDLRADADKGREIIAALAHLDVGQAVAVAQGQVLGIETIQGTDALLEFVAGTEPARRPRGGVLVKMPKPGQDLRVDMPAIGPETVDHAISAGLVGICIQAGHVLVLDQEVVRRKCEVAGLSLWAVEGGA